MGAIAQRWARMRVRRERPEHAWGSGLGDEVDDWREWVRTRGERWPADYERRLDPSAQLQDHVARHLPAGPSRVLDVGAGPLTSLGKVVPDQRVDCGGGHAWRCVRWPDRRGWR